MTMPDKMTALIQLHDGYSGRREGPAIEAMAPYLAQETIPVPTPGPGQAVIRVHMAAVNPSDTHFIKGEYGQPRVKGAPAGFEGVGEVVAGDTPLLGQRVSFYATASGTWAEYAMTDLKGLIPLRPDLKEVDAAGLLVNPLTAIAMFEMAAENDAESFILNAAGSQLGKFLIALGRDKGVKPIAVVRRAAQVDALKELGAAEVIVTSEPDAMDKARTIFRALKPRVLLDAVGDQMTADMFFAMPNRARWVNYGKLSTEPPALTEIGQLIFQHKRIEGFWLTRWMAEVPRARVGEAFAEAQGHFAEGRWLTDVAGIVPLSEAMNKLPEVLAKPDGKAFIDCRA
ncbi:MAG: zinc-binding dehydrogenase [Pseudomonadota bacterium]